MKSSNVFNVKRKESSMSTTTTDASSEAANDIMTSNNPQKNVRVMVQFQDTKLTRRSERPTTDQGGPKFKRQNISGNRYSNTTTTKYVVPVYVILLLGTMTAGVALIVLQKFVSGSTLLSICGVLILIGLSVCCTNMVKLREAERKRVMDQIELSHRASHEPAKKPPPPDPIMMRGITTFAFHGQGECEACLFHRKCEETRISGHPEFIPPSIRPIDLQNSVRNRNHSTSNGHVPNSDYAAEQRRQSKTDDYVRQKFLENANMKKFIEEYVEDDSMPTKKQRRRKLPQDPHKMESYRKLSYSANDVPLVDVYHGNQKHSSSYEVPPAHNNQRNESKSTKVVRHPNNIKHSNVATAEVYDKPMTNYGETTTTHHGDSGVWQTRDQLRIPNLHRDGNTSSTSIEVIMDLTDSEDDRSTRTIIEKEKDYVTKRNRSKRSNISNNNHRKLEKTSYNIEHNLLSNDCGPNLAKASDITCFT